MTAPFDRPRPFRAPEHVVDEWARLLGGWSPDAPPGSKEYAERVRAQARLTADRFHAESFAEGVQWAMQRQQERRYGVDTTADLLCPDPYAVRAEEMWDPRRLMAGWSEPEPVRMSVIRPQEYRPDVCPRCSERVTEWTVQYPILPDGSSGPSERVLLGPCRHSIKFVDDTREENFRAY